MKRKTLLIILLVPFIVAILGFVNVVIIKNYVEVDIAGIDWNYDETSGFKIREEPYKLEATAIFDESMILSDGNDLKWTVPEDENTKNICEITHDKDKNYFLKAKNEGETVITCSNEKGNKSRSFNAIIYENGAVVINPVLVGNGQSITGKRAFGQYDLVYEGIDDYQSEKVPSKIDLDIKVLPDDNSQSVKFVGSSDNVTYKDESMTFNGFGDAYLEFESEANQFITGKYNFRIIENGVNVYNYNDLLKCTNKSKKGEIVCLQTNLESLDNTYVKQGNKYINKSLKPNTNLFGNFDFYSQTTSFNREVYKFTTTYNTEYMHQYFNGKEGYEDGLRDEDKLVSGIRVQKDFYGNGFVINGRELTYPNHGDIDKYSGKLTPSREKGDLFLGPLTFVSLGDYNAPIMKVFGQDNSLMYVTGNDIVLEDLNIQNTDKFQDKEGRNNIYNLEYTGTCIDVKGKNVTLMNSRLQNARNTLRVYDSDGFTLKNSTLEQAREFLMKIGNNKVLKTIPNNIDINYDGRNFNGTLSDFMYNKTTSDSKSFVAQELLEKAIFDTTQGKEKEEMLKSLEILQKSLDTVSGDLKPTQNITIEDTYFYRSGIFAIAFDSYFNGPFLYNGSPLKIKDTFDTMMIPIVNPSKISGVMEPTNLIVKGDTRFYDWKNEATIDASCLVEERLGQLLGDFFGGKPDIDEYFPMKYALDKNASKLGYVYKPDKETKYLNTPVAWYGGGLNLSTITFEDNLESTLGDKIDVDISRVVHLDTEFKSTGVASLLAKCIPIAAGSHPFKFITNGTFEGIPSLFGEVPQIQDLKDRAKEANI